MTYFIESIIAWPFVIFLILTLLPRHKENFISTITFTAVGIHLLANTLLVLLWWSKGMPIWHLKEITLYHGEHLSFFIDFYYDGLTALFSVVGALLTFLVTTYSRVYLHKENGFKRFFYSMMFFYFGYTLSIYAGNLETLFIGWEILGITSFLLVAFYRNRYLPVKNAYKVYSIYRIGDLGFILAMWASHHLWHENITFAKLNNYDLVHDQLVQHSYFGFFIAFMLLISAAGKSAQFPFSSWLPRAMEGPTPSSAIFYGSLSVHLGAFLLMRTMPFWEHQTMAKWMIGGLGIVSALVSASIGRVQSSIKSQIAYASVSQIGLIFIELALGWKTMAMIHFAGNAFLRTYQLLVSPSVVAYLIKDQFYNHEHKPDAIESHFTKKIGYSLYLLSLKEWEMDFLLNKFLWHPLKNLGKVLLFINVRNMVYISLPALLICGVVFIYRDILPSLVLTYVPGLFALIGILHVLRAYAGRRNVFVCWFLIFLYHFWIALAMSFKDNLSLNELFYYLSGVVLSGILGYYALYRIKNKEKNIDLNSFQGHAYEYPNIAFLFLMSCLGMSGFPITLTFIGEDILFSHIGYDEVLLAFFLSFGFVIIGITTIRMYSRIFLGPHNKDYHEKALKSS